jgi:hypothetical protein
MSKSMETEGSPDSILATRDWLELIFLASAVCERRCHVRRCFRLSLKRCINSTKATSAGESFRKSFVETTLRPAPSSRLRFASSIRSINPQNNAPRFVPVYDA